MYGTGDAGAIGAMRTYITHTYTCVYVCMCIFHLCYGAWKCVQTGSSECLLKKMDPHTPGWQPCLATALIPFRKTARPAEQKEQTPVALLGLRSLSPTLRAPWRF